MAAFPFTELVKTRLIDKNKRLPWLLAALDKSERWFYNIKDFSKLELHEIELFTQLLDFNFLDEYNRWRLEKGLPLPISVSEPQEPYRRIQRNVNVEFHMSAPPDVAAKNIGKLLSAVKKEASKLGFDFAETEIAPDK